MIRKLSERGRFAAVELKERFDTPSAGVALTWDNHRWVRYRTAMAMLEDTLDQVRRSYEEPEEGERSYRELAGLAPDQLPSYPWATGADAKFALDASEALAELSTTWYSEQRLNEGAPRPEPELKARPKT